MFENLTVKNVSSSWLNVRGRFSVKYMIVLDISTGHILFIVLGSLLY